MIYLICFGEHFICKCTYFDKNTLLYDNMLYGNLMSCPTKSKKSIFRDNGFKNLCNNYRYSLKYFFP